MLPSIPQQTHRRLPASHNTTKQQTKPNPKQTHTPHTNKQTLTTQQTYTKTQQTRPKRHTTPPLYLYTTSKTYINRHCRPPYLSSYPLKPTEKGGKSKPCMPIAPHIYMKRFHITACRRQCSKHTTVNHVSQHPPLLYNYNISIHTTQQAATHPCRQASQQQTTTAHPPPPNQNDPHMLNPTNIYIYVSTDISFLNLLTLNGCFYIVCWLCFLCRLWCVFLLYY